MILIVFFSAEHDATPFLDWFDRLPGKAKVQCRARLQLLAEQGHQLRRPAADYLCDGIYELRAKAGKVHYRILYFFHGKAAVVISHGITKHGSAVPPIEIERARKRKLVFEADPHGHTFVEAS